MTQKINHILDIDEDELKYVKNGMIALKNFIAICEMNMRLTSRSIEKRILK